MIRKDFTAGENGCQEKSFPNRAANEITFRQLRALGFSLPGIRGALLVLNRVDKGALARAQGVSPATVSNTIRGHRHHAGVMAGLAEALGLAEADLFE